MILLFYSLSCVQLFVTPWAVALLGFSVRGILQASIREQVAISFSKGYSLFQGSNPGNQADYESGYSFRSTCIFYSKYYLHPFKNEQYLCMQSIMVYLIATVYSLEGCGGHFRSLYWKRYMWFPLPSHRLEFNPMAPLNCKRG